MLHVLLIVDTWPDSASLGFGAAISQKLVAGSGSDGTLQEHEGKHEYADPRLPAAAHVRGPVTQPPCFRKINFA